MKYPNRFRVGSSPISHKEGCKCFRCSKILKISPESEKKRIKNIKISLQGNHRRYGKYKGEKISYSGIHKWIAKRLYKPDKCYRCNLDKKLELSNNSGEYKRDLSDWEWICHRCHGFKDGWICNRRGT